MISQNRCSRTFCLIMLTQIALLFGASHPSLIGGFQHQAGAWN